MAGALVQTSPDELEEAPLFPGADVPIHRLFEYLRAGSSVDAFLEDFPSIRGDEVRKMLTKAEQALAECLEDEADLAFIEKHRHEPGLPLEEVLEELGISKEESGTLNSLRWRSGS